MLNRCVDDSESIIDSDIDTIVRKLCVSYVQLRRSFLAEYLYIENNLGAGDLQTVIKKMLEIFVIPAGFCRRVGYNYKTTGQPPVAVMKIETLGNNPIPFRGTLMFTQSKLSLLQIPKYRLIHVIAHELSHARLFLDNHELSRSEFATDVLALLVTGEANGFSQHMRADGKIYGYIKPHLHPRVFASLGKYSETIYQR